MANQAGRPIAPARKLVAAVMGTIAVFVMAVGLGMGSWAVVIFGVALVALSIALGMVNMVRRGARAWVTGSAEVKAISPPPTSAAVYGRAEIQAVVVAPGLPTSEVTIRDPRVPVAKWPHTGDTLPITVDVDDMRRVRINWDDAAPQAKGDDPPPPPAAVYGDDPDDELDNDLLGEVPAPPWTTRPDNWEGAADDTFDETAYAEGPVVVRDTPEGRIVEGELVDPDDTPPPLPRRATTPATPDPLLDESTATSAASAAPPEPEPEPDAGDPGPAAGPPSGAPASRPSTRPSGSRPSPHPRGGGTATATVEPETSEAPPPSRTPNHAPAATRSPQAHASAAPPPAQRSPHPDDAFLTDVPLDEPATALGTPATGVTGAEPRRGPQPTRTPSAPSPVSTFPTAPQPTAPPPTAPRPTVPRPTAPEPARSRYDDIDVPLDADPDIPPEATPAAAEALAEDLIAPPVEQATAEPARPSRATTFTTNAAHESTVPTASFPVQPPAPDPVTPQPPAPEPYAPKPYAPDASAPPTPAPEPTAPNASAPQTPAPESITPAASTPQTPAPEPAAPKAPALRASIPQARASEAAVPPRRPDQGPWADLAGEPELEDHTDEVITAYPSARPGPAGAIYGVGVTVLVTDLDRSIAFYRDVLGFFEIDNGDGSAVLASGDTRLVLRTVSGLSTEAGRLIYVNLEVGDVEAVYEELQAKGVQFVHPPRPVNRGDRLELWSATFRDPDDHNIAITQWRAIH